MPSVGGFRPPLQNLGENATRPALPCGPPMERSSFHAEAVSCWMLVVGCWLLDVGCWLVVVGSEWPLTTDNEQLTAYN